MATFARFQEYKDACDDLSDLCEQVAKDRQVFINMANIYQGWMQLYEPIYWKMGDDDVEELLRQVRDITEKVQMVIEIGLSVV